MRVLPFVVASIVVSVSHDSPGALGPRDSTRAALLPHRLAPQRATPSSGPIPSALPDETAGRATKRGPCPSGMVEIGRGYCIDRYEASLTEVLRERRRAALAVLPGGAFGRHRARR